MEEIFQENRLFLIYFQDSNDERVSITLTKIETMSPYINIVEAGTWITIGIEGSRSREAVQFSLAAGLAYTLGKLNDSIILDEVGYWSKHRESTPSEFYNELAQEKEHNKFSFILTWKTITRKP
ncbi:hypothetical protein [Paenibacillus tyrfis]|uniref:hypothetical protein n=1 Tax=Paenibacillus tyrfis TaxID=1501230 RepID=UPI00209F0846|nr:hypothetical protein [Paenibacillus tyrfis]MCP1311768.1 hypothetical protein [Paenibacillus tyrfis]